MDEFVACGNISEGANETDYSNNNNNSGIVADDSVPPDPNHRGAIKSGKIIACDNITGGANESDCSNTFNCSNNNSIGANEIDSGNIATTTTTTATMEVPMEKLSLVATPAEVQMKPIVATTTTEVPMDESSLVAASTEVQRN